MSGQNAAATFDPLRPKLTRIAYRMLGSVADAEDMVQKAFLRWPEFTRLTNCFFPPIKVLHPLPCHRFDAKTRGRSPVR